MSASIREMFGLVARDYRACWKPLVLTDLAFKVVAFVVLTPLVGILFRSFVAMAGHTVLADEDILFYFLGPMGWVTIIIVGAVWVAIVALQQAALLAILSRTASGQPATVLDGLGFAWQQVAPVLKVTVRLVGLALLIAVPFLAAGGAVYLTMLTEYDINFYLTEKPPEFWTAVMLIGAILTAMACVLLWFIIGWVLALPIVLFEQVAPADVLRTSRERAAGHRQTIAKWIVCWALANLTFGTCTTALVGLFGRLIVPTTSDSLRLLVLAIGLVVIVWAIVALANALVGATTFATMLANLYRKLSEPEDLTAFDSHDATPTKTSLLQFRLTRVRLIYTAGIAACLAALVGVVTLRSLQLEDHTEIMAHRGASAAAPENTLAAIQRAIDDDADWIEIDVQESKDGQIVVVHDSDLKKVNGPAKKIWDSTAAELRSVDIGSWFLPEFAGERVPLLGEVLEMAAGKIKVNIELKHYGHAQQLEQRVIDLVEAHNMQDNVVLMSLKYDSVKKAKALRPKWKVGLLTAVALGDLTELEADFLAVNAKLGTRRFIRRAHDRGKEVYIWTVNEPISMSVFVGRGADALITDEPALARDVLWLRSTLNPFERLLLELAHLFGVEPDTPSSEADA